jgi:predicted DCC family thiol-disulfide oxidoreductase YuxK
VSRLFFDGGCGLCQGAVRFAARHDPAGAIRFAPLGGETFRRLVPDGLSAHLPDSLVVLTPSGKLLLESDAVLHLLSRMGPGWRWLGAALALVPVRWRDAAYRGVARRRRRGAACPWAPPADQDRVDP